MKHGIGVYINSCGVNFIFWGHQSTVTASACEKVGALY